MPVPAPTAVRAPGDALSVVRRAGSVCLLVGLLGAGSGISLAAVAPVVDEGQWSYPQSVGAFALTQTWFAVQHLGLLAGILALGRSGAAGTHRRARLATRVAVGGMAALALIELIAILPGDQPADASFPLALGAVYGVVTTVLGVSLTVLGVDVARTGRWTGWRRWVPLSLGVWVFVPMFPAMAASFLGARLSISGWMVLFALLGLALLRSGTPPRP